MMAIKKILVNFIDFCKHFVQFAKCQDFTVHRNIQLTLHDNDDTFENHRLKFYMLGLLTR